MNVSKGFLPYKSFPLAKLTVNGNEAKRNSRIVTIYEDVYDVVN